MIGVGSREARPSLITRRDPDALRRLLSQRAWSGPLDAIADAAHRAEVAVMAYALEPRLPLADVALRQRRFDALLELALADSADALVGVAPVALLKGSAAAAWAYPETAWRMRRDIDLLVADALPEARAALLARGWRDAATGLSPAHRAWPMVRELGQSTVSIDLHRRLTHAAGPDVQAMLASRVAGRASLPVTSVADTIVHTTLHLTNSGFHEPLKGWVDLARLVPLTTPHELAARAALHRAKTATWACLGVLERWFVLAPDYRAAFTRPLQGVLVDALLAGDGMTPETWPVPRGVAYRLWRRLARDLS